MSVFSVLCGVRRPLVVGTCAEKLHQSLYIYDENVVVSDHFRNAKGI